MSFDKEYERIAYLEAENERLRNALKPFQQNVTASSLRDALGHVSREHLLTARLVYTETPLEAGTMIQPTIRELEDGCVVVDFGRRWFRCWPDGRVTAKVAKCGKVLERPATSRERLEALAHAAFDPETK